MYAQTYRALARIARRLPLGTGKLGRSVEGRRGAASRWSCWATAQRHPERRLWIHAASVGEALTAEPVIRRLVAADPDLQVVVTHSSPSLSWWPTPPGVARVDYVPWDGVRDVSATLDALNPSLLAFSRGDLWPELAAGAADRGIPIAIFASGVHPDSGRLHWPLRPLLRRQHAAISFAGALSATDADRLRRIGIRDEAVRITGDPRHDYVLERPANTSGLGALSKWGATGRTTLVAGSVERSDEVMLLDAYAAVLNRFPSAQLVLVPHEPSAACTARLLRSFARRGIAAHPWQPGEPAGRATCVVVTVTGRLADIYSVGDVCYVGGGFERGRLHSVLEPAAWGRPIVCGPDIRGRAEATALIANEGGVPLPLADAGVAMANVWLQWIGDPAGREKAGRRALDTLRPGGSTATVSALRRLLRRSQTAAQSSPR